MTVQKIDWLKRNFITLSNLIILLVLFAKQVAWHQEADDKHEIFEEHRISLSVHMPLEEKIKIFITRNEYNEMGKKLDLINVKVDMLLNNELSKNTK